MCQISLINGLGRKVDVTDKLPDLLVLTRMRSLPVGDWLRAVEISLPNILGTGISNRVQPLYLPGTTQLSLLLYE